jgi:RND family efflux transporter MFP subunit
VADPSQADTTQARRPAPSTAELIEHLHGFEGQPREFLQNLLVVQCQLASASAGAILRPEQAEQVKVLAAWPPLPKTGTPPVWLAQAIESAGQALQQRKASVLSLHQPNDLYGAPPSSFMVLLPIHRGQQVDGLAVFVMENTHSQAIQENLQKLELTVSLLSLYEMRLLLQNRETDLARLQSAMHVLSTVNTHKAFRGSAMALCNETASQWNADRVSLGILKGRAIALKATSHTEKFSRKMQLVQDIESAMEECLDQDVEILAPPPGDATYVSRSTQQLARRHGPNVVLSLPLRIDGQAVAVLTLEREEKHPFTLEEIEALRLLGDLVVARVMSLFEQDRWFGAKLAAGARHGLGAILGPKHTWMKVAALIILGMAAFLIFAKGDYNADAPFLLEATRRQVVPAPFESYLQAVYVEPGETVTAGQTVLARLDATDLRLQRLEAQKELLSYQTQAKAARREGKYSEVQVAQAKADQIAARIELLTHRIEQAEIVAPMSGTVVQGELKRQIGAPVKAGDLLFEVAPLDRMRAELSVPEEYIADVTVGDEGELATVGSPESKIPFRVERIFPVAEVQEGNNVFKVRVRLLEDRPGLRPGMEGLAKIHLGQKPYGWLWTRQVVNWIRMKLWL